MPAVDGPYTVMLLVCAPLCVAQGVALAPACGPQCAAPRPDFLIGGALASPEESTVSDRFSSSIQARRDVDGQRRLLACRARGSLCALDCATTLRLLTTTQVVTLSHVVSL